MHFYLSHQFKLSVVSTNVPHPLCSHAHTHTHTHLVLSFLRIRFGRFFSPLKIFFDAFEIRFSSTYQRQRALSLRTKQNRLKWTQKRHWLGDFLLLADFHSRFHSLMGLRVKRLVVFIQPYQAICNAVQWQLWKYWIHLLQIKMLSDRIEYV